MKRIAQIIGSIGLLLCLAAAIWLRLVVTAKGLGYGLLLAAVGSGIALVGVRLYEFASSSEVDQKRVE